MNNFIFSTFLYKWYYTKEVEYFIDRDMNIVFAEYNHLRIASQTELFTKNPFIQISKYNHPPSNMYNDTVLIRKYGNRYEIKIGSNYLCAQKEKIMSCEDKHQKWDIMPLKIGYYIKRKGLCLTYIQNEFKLLKCAHSTRQIFDFQIVPEIFECIRSNLSRRVGESDALNKKNRRDYLNKYMQVLSDSDLLNQIEDYIADEDLESDINELMRKMGVDPENSPDVAKVLKALREKSYDGWGIGWIFTWFLDLLC
ncbi:hypothetical protein EDEG_03856 [Edhazardia aedis USNM 41457]|uniref:Uncharacterized protein n=1 Tax=Edhazardia aedis (strain USNM 41457) TaxID=1003232 RepID=J8ZPJ6_EDHAE|nr:hypothetical protein EDEG_03856 [Edhazardia aedis USNM 41457]|eukprot:EJW01598.1 hypothetical protein EDEG_03856 [Edhazardia aedis USNM 41457]